MRRKLALFIAESVALGLAVGALLWYFLPANTIPAKIDSAAQAVSYHAAVQSAAPAVVSIYTSRVSFGQTGPSSLGSGVIIDAQGYVLTNDHVVKNADEIAVALQDGRSGMAKIVARDPETDLAVLSIALKDLPVLHWGRPEQVRVGDVVLAIGSVLGVGQTVTMGIVSGTGRNQLELSTFENFIQTDAAINPGNSGGALINTAGELIGINTAILSRSGGSEGIGFAIPADIVQDVLRQILEHGRVTRGWLGIFIQDLTPQLAESFQINQHGVLVAGTVKPGPADAAGLRQGDLLIAIDGAPAQSSKAVLNKIAMYTPGSELELTVLRGDQKLTIKVKVSERPQIN